MALKYGGSNPPILDFIFSMSQKVHAKSLRVSIWQSFPQTFFREKNYAHSWGNLFSLKCFLTEMFTKSFLCKISKAPSKRRLKKPIYSIGTFVISQKGLKVQTCPILYTFPRKGFAQKYFPMSIRFKNKQKSKKFRSFL